MPQVKRRPRPPYMRTEAQIQKFSKGMIVHATEEFLAYHVLRIGGSWYYKDPRQSVLIEEKTTGIVVDELAHFYGCGAYVAVAFEHEGTTVDVLTSPFQVDPID